MLPDFSQRYDYSMSTSFSSKLRGNCPCILFPCHLSFVFSAMLSFIFRVSFCTSVFRHLAACNTAESVLCWCVLTTCISGSSFLPTYSANFVISTAWAASARYYYYYYYYVLLPLCRVFTIMYLKQTTFLVYIMLQLFCIYNLCHT